MIYKYIISGSIICAIVWAIDDFGYDRSEKKWIQKWTERELQITAANLAHEENVRELQGDLQKANDEVTKNGSEKRNSLEIDISDGRDTAARVRNTAAEYAASAKECPGNTSATGNSQATPSASMVLAKLFSSCEQRTTELAAAYDKAKIAGDKCAELYETQRLILMGNGLDKSR
jgi:hypothetical protein